MTKQAFILPPVPPSSRALVDALKRRLLQAIEAGKPCDARIYLNIIERLARMDWLDETLSAQKHEAERLRKTQVMATVDSRLARFPNAQAPEPPQQEHKAQQVPHVQKPQAKQEARTAAQTQCPSTRDQTGQALPTYRDVDASAAIKTKRFSFKPAHRVAFFRPHVITPRDQAKMVQQALRYALKSGVTLPP